MRLNKKKILKWIKYIFLFLVVLNVIGVIVLNRTGDRIYGAYTEQVDYSQFKPEEGAFAITNVNMLSINRDSIVPSKTVFIKEGLIVKIDSTSNNTKGFKIIDGAGKFLIPGLIDAHVHLFKSPNDLLLYIANGVTEIRELIGEENHLEWREEIENGRIGPKMFVATPRLGSFSPAEGFMMEYSQGFLNIKNAKEAKSIIEKLHAEGYDGVKIYSQLNKEAYLEVTKTAKSLGMPVFGHVPFDITLEDIYSNGQSSIAHFEELMNALRREFKEINNLGSSKGKEDEFLQYVENRSPELASNLIKHNITITSTLWLTESFVRQRHDLINTLKEVELEYENPGISEWSEYILGGLGWLPKVNRYKIQEELDNEGLARDKKFWDTYGQACTILAKNLSQAGVVIMAGTDANLPPAVPGFSLHDELVSLNNAGMSNSQVLKSATSVPAKWLKSNSGSIEIGYEANLILLDKNPLDDIRNTKKINTVINRGKVYNRILLDKMLEAIKIVNDKSRTVEIDEYLD